MKINNFEELEIWKLSLRITKNIYDLTSFGLFNKDYGLKDQIRRAVISISSNIVEGFEKRNNNEFVRFLRIAKGSVGEVRNQLYIALAINYLEKTKFNRFNKDLIILANQIGRFISYLETQRKKKNFILTH